MKIKLNESIILSGVLHGKGEEVEVSDNMYNTLKTDGVNIEEAKEEPKYNPKEYKRKEKSEDDI